MAAVITALIGGVTHTLTANPAISPFHSDRSFFSRRAEIKFSDILPWTMPLLWIVAVFTARGVMRLILRPWRKTKTYGWWLIGLTAALVAGV